MGLISKVGTRSLKVRALYMALFVVLCIGAVSMVYPLLIMAAGSMQSDADSYIASPYPLFWFDNTILYRKFIESKYNDDTSSVEAHWGVTVDSWETIEPPPAVSPEILQDYLAWRKTYPIWTLGFTRGGKMLPIDGRLFRNLLYKRYDGNIDTFGHAFDLPYTDWSQVVPPLPGDMRTERALTPFLKIFDEFRRTRPMDEHVIPNLDALFWLNNLVPKYTTEISGYNQAHGTHFQSYREVRLTPAAPPPSLPLQRADWDDFVRHDNDMKLIFLRLAASLAPAYRRHLANVYGDIKAYNAKFGTHFASYAQAPFPTSVPGPLLQQVEWDGFIQDEKLCPTDDIRIYGPRQDFEKFVAAKRGGAPEEVAPIDMPVRQAEYHDTLANSSSLRWEFSTRNYKDVIGYVLLHGNGIINTIIFCGLAILTNLLVNPLAAYALSRYKLPSTYTILLFCMATMAFPGEVTMIPKFLLMKSFPLWGLVAGTVGFTAVLLGLSKLFPRVPESLRILVSLVAGISAGVWLVPMLTTHTHVSLLNTFSALILPGMASGFSIFLLKGFFDSLPIELYEAADIDGASEWRKFWMITMGLSKPILAVIGLGAFTGAYSQFMMALIIVPDQKMWPLMVWLFQLQSVAHQSVIYASLMIAAVPTLLVFIFCQNLIIRGIVVPVEK